MNLYGFVGNDGLNRWDYLGLKEFSVTIMAAQHFDDAGKAIPDIFEDKTRESKGPLKKQGEIVIEAKTLEQTNTEMTACDCIKKLTIQTHGNKGFTLLTSKNNPRRYKFRKEQYLGYYMDETAINKLIVRGFSVFKGVTFCKGCSIDFRGCSVGGDAGVLFLKAVANATGCTAHGFKDETTADPQYLRAHPDAQYTTDINIGPDINNDPKKTLELYINAGHGR